MGFQEIKRKKGHALMSGVGLSCIVTGKKGKSKKIVRFRFGQDVCTRMQLLPGNRVCLKLGNGSSKGQLKITKAKDGYLGGFTIAKPTGTGAARGGSLQVTELSDGAKHVQELVPHKFSRGALYITLPDWAVKTAKHSPPGGKRNGKRRI